MEKIAAIKFKQLLQRKKKDKSYDSLFWDGSKPLLSMDPMKNDKILLSKMVKSFQKYKRYYECYFSFTASFNIFKIVNFLCNLFQER